MAIDFDLPICSITGTLYVVFKAVSFVLEVSMVMKTKLRKLSLRIFDRKLKQLFDKKTLKELKYRHQSFDVTSQYFRAFRDKYIHLYNQQRI